jgi:hypothetical protein
MLAGIQAGANTGHMWVSSIESVRNSVSPTADEVAPSRIRCN